MIRKTPSCLCILFSAILALGAGAEETGEGPRKAGRSAWFACTSLPDGFQSPAKVMAGKEITECELPEFIVSKAVKIPDDGILRLVRVEADPGDPGKQRIAVLAQAKIPASVRKALIILSPLPRPEGDLIFKAHIQDLSFFKGGDRMFINLSQTEIAVQLGDTTVAVPSRQAKIYSTPKLSEATNMPIIYRYYHTGQKKWKLMTASTVVVMPTRREICIFNDGSRPGRFDRHKIVFPVESAEP